MTNIYSGDGNVDGVIVQQMGYGYTNIATMLPDEDLTPNDFVRLQMFFTGRSYRAAAYAARDKLLGDAKPLSALMIVAGLAPPEFLDEVEAMAV